MNTQEHDSEEILRAIMDHVPEDITVAFGTDAVIHSVSKHGLCLIAKSNEAVTGIGATEHPAAWQVYHQDQHTPVKAEDLPLTRACRGETVRDEELFLQDSSGRMFPVLCNAGPILTDTGDVVGGIIAWRDNSRMHELLAEKSMLAADALAARAEADAANRAKDEFLAKLAHELRNPLSSVKGWTRVARKRIDSPVDVRRALDVIDSNTEVQRRLIEDLLNLNRIVSGSVSVDKLLLPLDLVLQRAVDAMRVTADRNGSVRRQERRRQGGRRTACENVGHRLRQSVSIMGFWGVAGGEGVYGVDADQPLQTVDEARLSYCQEHVGRQRAGDGLDTLEGAPRCTSAFSGVIAGPSRHIGSWWKFPLRKPRIARRCICL